MATDTKNILSNGFVCMSVFYHKRTEFLIFREVAVNKSLYFIYQEER
jgi:hypothetical protein